VDIANQLELQSGLRVLDIGCGIGGTARFLASRYRCLVTGIDLTPEYVEVGIGLNRRVGLSDQIELRVANALNLPFDEASFDRATLLHVGINIPDKPKMCAEIRRVLRPGARLAVYGVMGTGDADLIYPVPWARTVALSFVERPDDYR
jgi:ubiquinone/menaquinone biosynthesis C-methylase UbiE